MKLKEACLLAIEMENDGCLDSNHPKHYEYYELLACICRNLNEFKKMYGRNAQVPLPRSLRSYEVTLNEKNHEVTFTDKKEDKTWDYF